jgi:3-deoxy-D-manno-octulosonic-acid transferase
LVLEASREVQRSHPALLTIIVPRHPERGPEIESLAVVRGFMATRRSTGALPDSTTQVYIADTLGELGLFYRAAPFAFIGRSLAAHGGQNPLEPAQLGKAFVAGPYTENFEETFRILLDAQGEGRVQSASELATLANKFLADPTSTAQTGARAKAAAEAMGGALAATVELAENLLSTHARP